MFVPPDNLYAILGLRPDARPSEITAAFRTRAKLLHPDMPETGDPDAFMRLNDAYQVLSDPVRRAEYDNQPEDLIPVLEDEIVDGPHPWEAPRDPGLLWAAPVEPRWWHVLPPLGWAGIGAAGIAALAAGVVFLARPPTSPARQAKAEVIALAPPPPVAAPVAVAVAVAPPPPLPNPNAPLAPSHYILPSGEPATLWRRETDGSFVPSGQLDSFSSVEALRLLPDQGFMQVRAPGNQDGYVLAGRLAPGGVAQAKRASCIQTAGRPPASGEVLFRDRPPEGTASMQFRNDADTSIVVKVRDGGHATVAVMYVAPRDVATLEAVPPGDYRPEFASGDLWSRRCGLFMAGMRTVRSSGFDRLEPGASLTYSLPFAAHAGDEDVPDSTFVMD